MEKLDHLRTDTQNEDKQSALWKALRAQLCRSQGSVWPVSLSNVLAGQSKTNCVRDVFCKLL